MLSPLSRPTQATQVSPLSASPFAQVASVVVFPEPAGAETSKTGDPTWEPARCASSSASSCSRGKALGVGAGIRIFAVATGASLSRPLSFLAACPVRTFPPQLAMRILLQIRARR